MLLIKNYSINMKEQKNGFNIKWGYFTIGCVLGGVGMVLLVIVMSFLLLIPIRIGSSTSSSSSSGGYSTDVCWNRVQEMYEKCGDVGPFMPSTSTKCIGGEINYYWPNGCKGNKNAQVCTQMIIDLTQDEINQYKLWVSDGRPAINGCNSSATSSSNSNLSCLELKAQVTQELVKLNFCDKDSDCKLAYPGCPFGCHMYLNNNYSTNDVTEITSKYFNRKECSTCIYDCMTPPTVSEIKCISGKCTDTRLKNAN